jgi:small nuclear ribonucleoprotein (snRNP)-like protein
VRVKFTGGREGTPPLSPRSCPRCCQTLLSSQPSPGCVTLLQKGNSPHGYRACAVTGTLQGFDALVNLVIDDCAEMIRGALASWLSGPFTPRSGTWLLVAFLVRSLIPPSLRTDPSDPYRLTGETRHLGLVVCRGPSVSIISPVEGTEVRRAVDGPIRAQRRGGLAPCALPADLTGYATAPAPLRLVAGDCEPLRRTGRVRGLPPSLPSFRPLLWPCSCAAN